MKKITTQYKLNTKKPATLTLLVLISFGSIGAILFTPAIPAIQHYFLVSPGVAQWTVTLFLTGIVNAIVLFSTIALCYLGIPIFYSNAVALATTSAKDRSSASSILSFINMAVGVFGVFIMSLIHMNPQITMPIIYVGLMAYIVFLFFFM